MAVVFCDQVKATCKRFYKDTFGQATEEKESRCCGYSIMNIKKWKNDFGRWIWINYLLQPTWILNGTRRTKKHVQAESDSEYPAGRMFLNVQTSTGKPTSYEKEWKDLTCSVLQEKQEKNQPVPTFLTVFPPSRSPRNHTTPATLTLPEPSTMLHFPPPTPRIYFVQFQTKWLSKKWCMLQNLSTKDRPSPLCSLVENAPKFVFAHSYFPLGPSVTLKKTPKLRISLAYISASPWSFRRASRIQPGNSFGPSFSTVSKRDCAQSYSSNKKHDQKCTVTSPWLHVPLVIAKVAR